MTTGGPSRAEMIVSDSSAQIIESAKIQSTRYRVTHGEFETVPLFQMFFDQMGDDFSVCFGDELMILALRSSFSFR